jgi:hypothetical protein
MTHGPRLSSWIVRARKPGSTNPFYVVLSPNGEVLSRIGGYNEPPVFVDFLSKALGKLPKDVKVAQAASASGAQ